MLCCKLSTNISISIYLTLSLAQYILETQGSKQKKYDLPNQIFFAGQIPFSCQKWGGNECSHDMDLFLVLLPYTKLVYLIVVILDLGENIFRQQNNLRFLLSISGRSSGGSSVSQNKLPQLNLGYIYILKYLQSNFIG